MKATFRRNGRMMFTIRTEFHLDRERLIQWAVLRQAIYGELPGTLRSAEEELRDDLYVRGEGVWTDVVYMELEEEYEEEYQQRAQEWVDQMWPVLKGKVGE